jgi:hypothetical protein
MGRKGLTEYIPHYAGGVVHLADSPRLQQGRGPGISVDAHPVRGSLGICGHAGSLSASWVLEGTVDEFD